MSSCDGLRRQREIVLFLCCTDSISDAEAFERNFSIPRQLIIHDIRIHQFQNSTFHRLSTISSARIKGLLH